MGVASSKLSREQLAEYTDLTYFTEGEIVELHKKFESLSSARGDDGTRARISREGFQELPELKQNPFLERLCSVFSTASDGTNSLNFDDFLDMMNVLSEHAPFALKANYAFLLFDFNGNGFVDGDDIREIVQCITGRQEGMGSDELTNNLINSIMKEADLDQDNQLGRSEFEHVLSKSPDFMTSFKIRL